MRLAQAFRIALAGRPGPVLVDLPKDTSSTKLAKPAIMPPPELPADGSSTDADDPANIATATTATAPLSATTTTSPTITNPLSPAVPVLSTFTSAPELHYFTPPSGATIQPQLEAAAKLINEAQRPVILAGGGVINADASDVLRLVAERGNIPVATALQGFHL